MVNLLDIEENHPLKLRLEGKPPDWSQLIALRAALRVFPILFGDPGKVPRQYLANLPGAIIATWRCLFISLVARSQLTQELRVLAGEAAGSAGSLSASVSQDGVSIAVMAAADVAATTSSVSDYYPIRAVQIASYATTYSSGDVPIGGGDWIWDYVWSDCDILETLGSQALETAPLWMKQQKADEHDPTSVAVQPDWVEPAINYMLVEVVRRLGPDGKMITDWYLPLVAGEMPRNWSRMFLDKRAYRLASRKNSFWAVSDRRTAATIMEDISAALGWEKRNPWGVDPDEEAKRFIFLSHARADRPRATAVRNLLMEQGFEVWWDDDISGGDGWRDRIAERLDKAAVVLTLWSEHSVGRDAVREEAAKAQRNRKLVHARLDRADLPYGFGETHYIDMQSWDGTASHEAWRKLAQSLRDKITPPDADDMRQRLSASSPIAMVAESGMLSPRDTPPNARPTVVNAPDLEQRISALRVTSSVLRSRVDEGNYQVPQDLGFSLDMVASAINAEQLTWYAIADGHHSLCNCMIEHDAADAWNSTLFKDLQRFAERLLELSPLLQPEQVPADQPGAKPPQPEPTVLESEITEVEDIAESFSEIMDSDEARAVLSDSALAIGDAGADQVENSANQPDPDKRLPILRGGLKRMAYVAGGIISAIGGGVIINLLTAPEAAATLATRLKPLYDLMVKFFM
ncbi:toll/interleukin-1 receptor domain-containing protein [Hoeflea sp.]|uniref:toll/interleukin-1 receptor domain-containing protein n=1 Tax=Hoeflea sp. TaxID=1940281 RepID=UPI003BB09F32